MQPACWFIHWVCSSPTLGLPQCSTWLHTVALSESCGQACESCCGAVSYSWVWQHGCCLHTSLPSTGTKKFSSRPQKLCFSKHEMKEACVIAALTSLHSIPHRLCLGVPILPLWWESWEGDYWNIVAWCGRGKPWNSIMWSKTFQDDYKEGKLTNIQQHKGQENLLPTTGIKQGLEWHRWAPDGEEFGGKTLVSHIPDTEARQERDSDGAGSPTAPRVSESDLPWKELKEYLLLSSSYLSLPYVSLYFL